MLNFCIKQMFAKVRASFTDLELTTLELLEHVFSLQHERQNGFRYQVSSGQKQSVDDCVKLKFAETIRLCLTASTLISRLTRNSSSVSLSSWSHTNLKNTSSLKTKYFNSNRSALTSLIKYILISLVAAWPLKCVTCNETWFLQTTVLP